MLTGILMKSRTSISTSLLIADAPYVASRLAFDCSPKGAFLGLDVNGKRVSFAGTCSTSSGSKRSCRYGLSSTRRRSKPSFERTWCNAGILRWRDGFRARCFASPRNDDGESYRKSPPRSPAPPRSRRRETRGHGRLAVPLPELFGERQARIVEHGSWPRLTNFGRLFQSDGAITREARCKEDEDRRSSAFGDGLCEPSSFNMSTTPA